ncbi:MAG: hypothetical protein ABI868_15950 [Acidobacteriota bacterium]
MSIVLLPLHGESDRAGRERTDHDFSQYKQSTVSRRIERRMAVHQIESPG